MYGLHIVLLPMLIVTLVGVHVLLVRVKGVVRPIDKQQTAEPTKQEPAS
jgi:quinol-cytochrome oxidoreductase complex cytochrome b subunit